MDRLTANILKATSGENEAVENEVFELGARLFPELPEPDGVGRASWMIRTSRALNLRLESSAQGCRWLLDRWAELRSMLVQEQAWQSPDKLKAIRLLGKYPLDALDDTQVTVVFLACHRIDSSGGELFHEIGNGLSSDHWEICQAAIGPIADRAAAASRPRRGESGAASDRRAGRGTAGNKGRGASAARRARRRLHGQATRIRRQSERRAASQLRGVVQSSPFSHNRCVHQGAPSRRYRQTHPVRPCHRAVSRVGSARRRGNRENEPNSVCIENTEIASVASVEQGMWQNEPNSVCIENTEIESAASVEQGTWQNEPNSVCIENTEIESAASVEQGTWQNEPNFVGIETTEIESAASVEQGMWQNEPNFVGIESTEIESTASVEQGMWQNEPNLVDMNSSKKINKDKGHFRRDRRSSFESATTVSTPESKSSSASVRRDVADRKGRHDMADRSGQVRGSG